MRMCKLLDGENIVPGNRREALMLVGKRVKYLRRSDIDHSGRGYIFPREGRVQSVHGKNIQIDDDWEYLSSFVEMVELL